MPPPPGGKTPGGRDGLAELAAAGVTFVRTGMRAGTRSSSTRRSRRSARSSTRPPRTACAAGSWLGELTDLPLRKPTPPARHEQLLTTVVNALQGPRRRSAPGRASTSRATRSAATTGSGPPGSSAATRSVKALDPDHPVVIIQAPRQHGRRADAVPARRSTSPAPTSTRSRIRPARTSAGEHGHQRRRRRDADDARGGRPKPVWMTLQIAWSGVTPSSEQAGLVPRFPTLHEERFMTYQAIANGARGLNYFGGHLTQVATPEDAEAGWNWTFWEQVAAAGRARARLGRAPGRARRARREAGREDERRGRRARDPADGRTTLYVIAVRRGGATSRVAFTGLPSARTGARSTRAGCCSSTSSGRCRRRSAAGSSRSAGPRRRGRRLRDWFAPHDAHVYRFAL